jgi:hypothetical protein
MWNTRSIRAITLCAAFLSCVSSVSWLKFSSSGVETARPRWIDDRPRACFTGQFFAIFASLCSKVLVVLVGRCEVQAIVEEDRPRKERKDTETEKRQAPTRLDVAPSRTALSTCPHSFRAFRSFRGQIFFLPVRLRVRQRQIDWSIFLRLRGLA